MQTQASTPSNALSEERGVVAILLHPEGEFPNNEYLPALHYRRAFEPARSDDLATVMEDAFERHDWTGGWRNGVYDFHHYHSTAHEVLGCYAGHATLQLGGPGGPTLEFESGDVLVIPAGVAHCCLEAGRGFGVVGAYAGGKRYDMKRGLPGEGALAERNIAAVESPQADPVLGALGPLIQHWRG